jgi:hypothetical protein
MKRMEILLQMGNRFLSWGEAEANASARRLSANACAL